jgi:uncharacterized membrane protein YdcZ (DUF606 family)
MKNLSLKQKRLIAYAISFVVGCLFSLVIFWVRDLFKQTELRNIYWILSDGFFFSGVLLFGSGMLVFLSNEGTFNFLSYAVQRLLSRFIHTMKVTNMTYTDFVGFQKSREKTPFAFLLIVGAVFILVAGLFAILMANLPA